ncbi:MAG TPA: polymorphic toxin-type HINT domain-containing protein [Pirellulales bacterium]|nr:polymorphic toxin-type HINT domain-containing protein [Pirellulales bacterium]
MPSAFCLEVTAATKGKSNEAQLQTVLAAEAKGGAIARDQELAGLIESAPKYAPARWAAGYLESDGRWLKFDDWPNTDMEIDKLADYRQLREDTPDNAEGNLKLATWCRERGLKDQERAHLLRVLDFEPDRNDLRKRAGMVEVGGVWMSPQEARQAALRGKQAVADLKHWLPRIERLREAVNGPEGHAREFALEQIRAIRDPSAVTALETVLAPANDDAGVAVVDALAAIKRPAAAISLARLATFSQSSDTIDAAREKLKSLPRDHFVPAMLASLVIPRVQESKVVYQRYGRLVFEQAFVYERSDRKIAAVFDNVYQQWWVDSRRVQAPSLFIGSVVGSAKGGQRTIVIGAANRQLERTNGRIIETLREVTGQKLPDDPSAWWKWWNDVNETVLAGKKPTQLSYYQENTLIANYPGGPLYAPSCLVAGTPVWTDRGSVAIEQVCVGDRVLAQDAGSGELAYKPVLHTTVRPKAPLLHISVAGETIVASGGHPFWISGQGWVNARELQPEMSIHTVTGAVPIEKIATDDNAQQPVYNLIVEDFHNYLAGTAHLLLHDTSPRQPAPGPVPGWKE